MPLYTELYAAQMYHDLLQGLGISGPCPDITINVPKKDIEWAEAEQKRLGIQESGYVLIHGGSSKLSKAKGIDKIYPVSGWQKIIQDFQKRQPNLPIVVVQGPDDADFVKTLQQVCPAVKVTTPGDVGKLAAMIAGASLMLCTDSAPMHLAVAVQTYVLSLFGPTDPAKLLPASPSSGETRFVGIKSPSGKMADITPETVLKKVWGG